jgi:NitT/TauT family transport system substrate-binding protein
MAVSAHGRHAAEGHASKHAHPFNNRGRPDKVLANRGRPWPPRNTGDAHEDAGLGGRRARHDDGRSAIKGVAATTTYPLFLITKNPAVKSIKDFSSTDKIAVPSVKISTQAIMLQMAAAEAFGEKDYAKLDPLTISLSHPDAVLAMTNNTAGVNAHFSSSPFYEQEMKMPGMRLITTNYEILGGPATAIVLTTTTKFREQNPKAYRAFYDGLKDAIDLINKDKRAAAQMYLDLARDQKNTVDDIHAIIADKDYNYTLQPQKVLKTAQFMAKVGSIKQAPKALEDMFFPEAAGLGGD